MSSFNNRPNNIIMYGARIIFRNFSGAKSKFNREGDRNFCLVLNQEMADELNDAGWNVCSRPARTPDEEPLNYIRVKVKYNSDELSRYNPDIYKVTHHKKVHLNEQSVSTLDSDEIENIDLEVRPRQWSRIEPDGTETVGISAYLKTMYVTIAEDEFAEKYGDFDEVDAPFEV